MFVLSQIFGSVTDRSAILKRCIGKKLSAKLDIEIFHIILASFSLKIPRDHERLLHIYKEEKVPCRLFPIV